MLFLLLLSWLSCRLFFSVELMFLKKMFKHFKVISGSKLNFDSILTDFGPLTSWPKFRPKQNSTDRNVCFGETGKFRFVASLLFWTIYVSADLWRNLIWRNSEAVGYLLRIGRSAFDLTRAMPPRPKRFLFDRLFKSCHLHCLIDRDWRVRCQLENIFGTFKNSCAITFFQVKKLVFPMVISTQQHRITLCT